MPSIQESEQRGAFYIIYCLCWKHKGCAASVMLVDRKPMDIGIPSCGQACASDRTQEKSPGCSNFSY